MHSEVALQAQSGGTESGTVGALEVCGCDGCSRCSMALISGSSDLLAQSVLKVFNSFVSSAAPLWPFTGGLPHLLWLELTTLKAAFDGVLVPFLRVVLVSFALQELSVQQASWHAVLLHPDDMSYQPELCLEEHGLDTRGVSTVQDFEVCDAVLPLLNDKTEFLLLGTRQHLAKVNTTTIRVILLLLYSNNFK